MNKNTATRLPIVQALFAAALFGMSAPFSKLLLVRLSPLFLSALLYLGAGLGMLILDMAKRISKAPSIEARLTKRELPFIFLMIVLDILAPVSLMIGLTKTSAANASLLNNFEIVATSVIALMIFKETIGRRLWLSIGFITLSSIILTINDLGSLSFSAGSLLVILACLFWGLENNCTRKLSLKDPLQVVIIKGFGSGSGALIISLLTDKAIGNMGYILSALLLGFFAYGMSIFYYVTAQRSLGAARTSAYYAAAPFIGAGISLLALREPITVNFIIALVVMLAGTYLVAAEKHQHQHNHEYIEHEHRHNHADGHHNHFHENINEPEHSHPHVHEAIVHTHSHTPDMHHSHSH